MAPFLAKNAQNTLCLKGWNICLQKARRMKVGSMSKTATVMQISISFLVYIYKLFKELSPYLSTGNGSSCLNPTSLAFISEAA